MTSPSTRPRRVLVSALALVLGCAASAVGAPAGAAVWRNAAVRPVTLTVEVPVPTTVGIEVERRGVVVLRGAPVAVGAGRATLAWRGAGATADGRYVVSVRDEATGVPIGAPVPVLVNRHAPRGRLIVPPIAIPRPPGPPLVVRIADVEPGGVMVRPRLALPGGGSRPLGRWRRWTGAAGTAPILAAVRAAHVVGPVSVGLDLRDAAGNVSTAPAAWVDPASGPTPPLVVVRRVVTSRPWVALTFDDGYDPAAIESILTTLDRLGARATFCFNAVNVPRWPQALRDHVRRDVNAGRLGVCNHGYSHRTSATTSEGFDVADIAGNAGWDRVAGLSSIPFYRPPGGAYGPALTSAAHVLGYRYLLLWSIDTRDWSGPTPEQITSQVVGGARSGSIVLEHGLPNSAAALPGIIEGLRRRGLEPVRIGDLLAAGASSL